MNKKQAQNQLKKFIGNKIVTFSVKHHNNGEWTAQCNEIPAIMTGGTDSNDTEEIKELMRDAIFTAAGIPAEHCDSHLLRDASLNTVSLEYKEDKKLLLGC